MPPSTSPREALFACPFSPPWNLPSFTVEFALSSPCYRSDLPSIAKVRPSLTLTLSYRTIWCSGPTALFLFLLAKVARRPCQLLTQWHRGHSFLFGRSNVSKFFAETCAILQAFCWSRQHHKSATSLTLATLYATPSFLLFQSLLQIWQERSSNSYSIRLKWVPGYSFFTENDAADELARREALLVPSAMPCSLSPPISRIHSCLSHLNSSTYRFPLSP